jgi:predicted DNA-binding protein YlxM (UPF0122 family)
MPTNKKISDDVSLAKAFKEEKSVRATFQMSKEGCESLKWIKRYYGTSMKIIISLAIIKFIPKIIGRSDLERISEASEKIAPSQKVQKTMVLTNAALDKLNNVAKQYKIPRDTIINHIVQIIKILAERESKAQQEKHEAAKKLIDDFWQKAEQVEEDLIQLCGEDDPISWRFGKAVVILMNLSIAIGEELEKGTPVDPEDM